MFDYNACCLNSNTCDLRYCFILEVLITNYQIPAINEFSENITFETLSHTPELMKALDS